MNNYESIALKRLDESGRWLDLRQVGIRHPALTTSVLNRMFREHPEINAFVTKEGGRFLINVTRLEEWLAQRAGYGLQASEVAQ